MARDGRTIETLKQIAIGGALVLVAATSPYFLHNLAKSYFKERSRNAVRSRARQLRRLERRKLVSFERLGEDRVRLTLTPQGRETVRCYDLNEVSIPRPKRWDGRWRIVMYDIPEGRKKAREAFRSRLRALGFYQLQKSVWLFPFECRNELKLLADMFDLALDRHIFYIRADAVPGEAAVRRFFDLRV